MAVEVIDLTSDLSDDDLEEVLPRKIDTTPASYPSQQARLCSGRFGSRNARDGVNGTQDGANGTIIRRHIFRQDYSERVAATASGRSQDDAVRQERVKECERFREREASRNALVASSPMRQNQTQRTPLVKSTGWKVSKFSQLTRISSPLKQVDNSTNRGSLIEPGQKNILEGALRLTKRTSTQIENTPPTNGNKRARTDTDPMITERDRSEAMDLTQSDTEHVPYSNKQNVAGGLRLNSATTANSAVGNKLGNAPKDRTYSPEEDELLRKLKDEDGLSWEVIASRFPHRTEGALRTRYHTFLKFRAGNSKVKRASEHLQVKAEKGDPTAAQSRSKRERKTVVADGFVSWTSIKHQRKSNVIDGPETSQTPLKRETSADPFSDQDVATMVPQSGDSLCQQDGAYLSSLAGNLRFRELGLTHRRAWTGSRSVTAEMTNHVFQNYRMQRQYQGTSGDVVALSWSPNGSQFAAGSIAISDLQSMQYNRDRNLLLGNKDELVELTDHHLPRPVIDGEDNVNALHAMRESQDPRLFMTVTSTGFSPDGSALLTAGADRMLRKYEVAQSLDDVSHPYAVTHTSSIDLLAIHPRNNWAATGCRSESNNLCVISYSSSELPEPVFYPGNDELPSQVPSVPSALKWGVAPDHHRFLLAGFSGDSEEAGETRLWDVEGQRRIELHAVTRGVFDVAWNPRPSAASITFVVASNSKSHKVDRGTNSLIQCFAPNQNGAHRIMWWESQAMDINDVVICPYDENLIAAGATNGKVYVWDYRYVKASQRPLHTLEHGRTENVIDYEQELQQGDTGVRFLSWGAAKDRLYSGSSDSVVKIWNPYRSPGNAFINDITTPPQGRAAIMSGSFSPDYRELLLGKENGRIELFEAGGQSVYKALDFKLRPAASPYKEDAQESAYAASRELLESKKVEVRPCGAMPFRQAVQGPCYSSSFLASLDNDIAQAAAYLETCTKASASDHEDEADLTKANADRAMTKLVDLMNSKEHFDDGTAKALDFQQSLVQSERKRKALVSSLPYTPEPCNLDCTVLRASEEAEIDDSRRSELRIPDVLRTVAQNAIAAKSSPEEGGEVCCFSCRPERKNFGKSCAQCAAIVALQRLELRAVCIVCSGPARVPTGDDDTKTIFCEKCCFACFRCGEPAILEPDMARVTCEPCGHTWEVNALGYELKTPLTCRPKKAQPVVSSADEDWDTLGEEERDHYTGRATARIWVRKSKYDEAVPIIADISG